MPTNSKRNKSPQNTAIDSATQAAGAQEVVGRFGSAAKQHFVAYSGVDNESGQVLTKGLKGIAESKVDPNYRHSNLRQQAGFAAEVKYTAQQNAESIIDGSNTRYSRTDDLGRVNDPLYDHVRLDANGVEIIGSGEQMKFVGGSPKECLDLLKSSKYRKYLDADAILTVPSDYYEKILSEADSEIAKLSRQLERAQSSGKDELAVSIKEKIDRLNKIKKNLHNSGITNQEALEARLSPRLSTAKEVTKIAHRAGVEQLKIGAAISGSISLIRNLVSVCKGEQSATEAAKNLAKDTASGAVVGYGTAFAGSVIKGAMQNASGQTLRTLSKTNAPAIIVTSTLEIGKTMSRYFRGDIDGVKCLEELGEKGTSNLGAAMFAIAGNAVCPVLGGIVGSMIGYTLTSASYGELLNALKEEKLSTEHRKFIEQQCQDAIDLIEQYRTEMKSIVSRYFEEFDDMLSKSFDLMEKAYCNNDIDMFISGTNHITSSLGGSIAFNTVDECEMFMLDNNASLIL